MAFLLLIALFAFVSATPVIRVQNCPVVLPTHATPRIIGGDEASPHTRSHIVSFHEEGCGGSLISETWILTAAHCLVHEDSIARISGTNSSNGVGIPVKRVVNHPGFEFPKDDITLVELEAPAPSSASFMTVNSNPDVPEDGEFARVSGYGFQAEGFDHDHDAILHQVDIPVMNIEKCIKRYLSVHSHLRQNISARMHLCAGYDDGGCDSCTADSGGPLFVYDEQNQPIQIAIVSFGHGCAREVPGGYTRISTYVPWMKSVGAVFKEQTTRQAVFGDTVSGASGPDPNEESEPTNEHSTEPSPEHTPSSSPESFTDTGSTTAPSSSSTTTPANSTKEPNSIGSAQSPDPSPTPSPPGRLPPSQAVGTPAIDRPPNTSNSQGGHGGEARPRPTNESSPSNGNGEDSSDDQASNTDSDTGNTGADDNMDDGDTNHSDNDGSATGDTSNNTINPENTGNDAANTPSASNDIESAPPRQVADNPPDMTGGTIDGPQGDAEGVTQDGTQDNTEGATEEPGNSNGGDDDGGNVVGPVFLPEPSPALFVPSPITGTEEFEEPEVSFSPEVTESPEVSESPEANIADFEDGGLNGLQIAMIVVGSAIAITVVGYLVYFAMNKVQ